MMPGKRASILLLIFAFVVLIGVPVWLNLTRVERPDIPSSTAAWFERAAASMRPLVTTIIIHNLIMNGSCSHGLQDEVIRRTGDLLHDRYLQSQSPWVMEVRLSQNCHVEAPPGHKQERTMCLGATWNNTPSDHIRCLLLQNCELSQVQESAAQHMQPACSPSVVSAAVGAGLASSKAGQLHIALISGLSLKSESLSENDTTRAGGPRIEGFIGAERAAWLAADGGVSAEAIAAKLVTLVDIMLMHSARATLPVSAASEVTVNCVLASEDPGAVSTWDFEPWRRVWDAAAERLAPVLSLRTESAVSLFALARLSAPLNAMRNGTQLVADDLPLFVDSGAWGLEAGRTSSGHMHVLAEGAHAIPETLLHIVAYVPEVAKQPMEIVASGPASESTASFVVRDWGGLILINDGLHHDNGPRSGQLSGDGMRLFQGLALQQLRYHMGLPYAKTGSWHVRHGIWMAARGEEAVAMWEVDSLMRQQFVALMQVTAEAAQTLIKLIDMLPNLSIPDAVGQQLAAAQSFAAQALAAADVGDFGGALWNARNARTAAEVAASHPAIISLHNYPQQHLIAVYLPLFAPLLLPVLLVAAAEAVFCLARPAQVLWTFQSTDACFQN